MKKFLMLLAAASLVMVMTGCDGEDEFERFFDPGFRNNRNGSTEVINLTGRDMLLFDGERLINSNIVGGVRSGQTVNINFSDRSNYQTGYFALLRAVQVEEFRAHRTNARADHSAFVTFGAGRRFSTEIASITSGDFVYVVHNRSRQFALELRVPSATGDLVAFLTPGESRRELFHYNGGARMHHPVWVAFDSRNKQIVRFAPIGLWDAQDIAGVQRGGTNPIPEFGFPMGETVIEFPQLAFPHANVTVSNQTAAVGEFRIGVAAPLLGVGAIHPNHAITPGAVVQYEFSQPAHLGNPLDLNITFQAGQVVVPVRFANYLGDIPTLQAGRSYVITITGAPGTFEARIVDNGEVDRNELLSFPVTTR